MLYVKDKLSKGVEQDVQNKNNKTRLNFYLENIDQLNSKLDAKDETNMQLEKKAKEILECNQDLIQELASMRQENLEIYQGIATVEKENSYLRKDLERHSNAGDFNFGMLRDSQKFGGFLEAQDLGQ